MITIVGVASTIGTMLLIFRIAGPGRSFNSRRALLSTRNTSGPNATLMLAAASLAGLGVSIISNGARWQELTDITGPVVVLLLITGAAVLAFGGRTGGTIVGVTGLVAEFLSAALEHGLAGAMVFVFLAKIALFTLGLLRGLT